MTVKVYVCTNIVNVCVQIVLREVLECKLEDVDATASSPHRLTPYGNIPTLRSGVTSAGQRHATSCDASPRLVVYHWLVTGLER